MMNRHPPAQSVAGPSACTAASVQRFIETDPRDQCHGDILKHSYD
jgi:hypothetical protein